MGCWPGPAWAGAAVMGEREGGGHSRETWAARAAGSRLASGQGPEDQASAAGWGSGGAGGGRRRGDGPGRPGAGEQRERSAAGYRQRLPDQAWSARAAAMAYTVLPPLPPRSGCWPRTLRAVPPARLRSGGLQPQRRAHRCPGKSSATQTGVALSSHFGAADEADIAFLVETMRLTEPLIVGTGVATAEQIGMDTFEQRLRQDNQRSQAVAAFPMLLRVGDNRPPVTMATCSPAQSHPGAMVRPSPKTKTNSPDPDRSGIKRSSSLAGSRPLRPCSSGVPRARWCRWWLATPRSA
jgi:hypothetical protein